MEQAGAHNHSHTTQYLLLGLLTHQGQLGISLHCLKSHSSTEGEKGVRVHSLPAITWLKYLNFNWYMLRMVIRGGMIAKKFIIFASAKLLCSLEIPFLNLCLHSCFVLSF